MSQLTLYPRLRRRLSSAARVPERRRRHSYLGVQAEGIRLITKNIGDHGLVLVDCLLLLLNAIVVLANNVLALG